MEAKETMDHRSLKTYRSLCPGRIAHFNCVVGYCMLNGSCILDNIGTVVSKKQAKKILKDEGKKYKVQQVVAKEVKKAEHIKVEGFTKRKHKWAIFRISELLGEWIYEHELVKGDEYVTGELKKCWNIRQINKVLEKKHVSIGRKPTSDPANKNLYRMYRDEHKPWFVPPKK